MISQKQLRLKTSEFVERYIRINKVLPFSFKGREYLRDIYDSDADAELFMTARQCTKSTFLVNKILTRSATIPDLNTLYEAPREKQSKEFAKQKIKPIIRSSPEFAPFLTYNTKGGLIGASVLEYNCFKSGSRVTLSTTYDGGDRDRGVSMNDLYIDETQDQLEDDIVVISESLSASFYPPYMAWAGTPKSLSNYIEQLWNRSKKIYWHVLCTHCGTWQVPGHPEEVEDLNRVITPEGFVCKKCSKRLNMLIGGWHATNKNGNFNGWHISQPMRLVKGMIGSIRWKTPEGIHGIYDKFKYYTPAKFYNEVLGFSYDSAEKPLSMADLEGMSFSFLDEQKAFDPTKFVAPVIMGIDWGRNQNSYTVVSISYFYQGRPTLVYMEKFSGADADPKQTALKVYNLYKKFNCNAVYCDKGFFFHYKHEIHDKFGLNFVRDKFNFIQYSQDDKHMIKRSMKNLDKIFNVSRNDTMQLFISSIKDRRVGIYNFEQFKKHGFERDYLSVGYETRETKDKSPTLFFMTSGDTEAPTDCFHSHLYSWLGLMLEEKQFTPYLMTEKKDWREKYDS